MDEDVVPSAEVFSFVTHAVSALAAIVGLVLMAVFASGAKAVTSVVLYGATMVLLFSSSAFHHVVGTLGPRWHAVSKRLDHIAIYLLIAGTYTPVALVTLVDESPGWGWSIFGVIWGLALAGSLLKGFYPHTPRWFTITLYLVMGWVAVVAIWPLWRALPLAALLWLFGGGVFYSVGSVIYARKKPDPWPRIVGFHGVWHVFVMAGAAAHFVMVWRYVI